MKNVLLVDDSRSARMVLKKMLEKNSMEVELAESGEEAIVYLQSAKPDVIFMDHLMPGMDGLEVAKIISSDPKTSNIPIVMCTSKEGDEYIAEARAHGAVEILSKPPSIDQVKQIINGLNEVKEVSEAPESTPNTEQEEVEAVETVETVEEIEEVSELETEAESDLDLAPEFEEDLEELSAEESEFLSEAFANPASTPTFPVSDPAPAPAAGASIDKALVVSTVDSIVETRLDELKDSLKDMVNQVAATKVEMELEKALSSWQDATLVEATIHSEQAVKQHIEKDLDKQQSQIRSLAEILDQLHDEKEQGVDNEGLNEWKEEISTELNALAKRVNKTSVLEDSLDETIDFRIKLNSSKDVLDDELKSEIIKLTEESIASKTEKIIETMEEGLTERVLEIVKDDIDQHVEVLVRNIASVTATGAAKEALNDAFEKFEKGGKLSVNGKGHASVKLRWLFSGILLTLAASAAVSYFVFDFIPLL